MEDKLLDRSVTYMSFNIGVDPITKNMKKLLVSASGTRFTVTCGNCNYGEYELKPRLTEKNKLKFVLENQFGIDKVFDCNEDATLNAIGWIMQREMRAIDEIS